MRKTMRIKSKITNVKTCGHLTGSPLLSSHCVSMAPPAQITARSRLGAEFSAQLDTPRGQLHDPLTALWLYAHAY